MCSAAHAVKSAGGRTFSGRSNLARVVDQHPPAMRHARADACIQLREQGAAGEQCSARCCWPALRIVTPHRLVASPGGQLRDLQLPGLPHVGGLQQQADACRGGGVSAGRVGERHVRGLDPASWAQHREARGRQPAPDALVYEQVLQADRRGQRGRPWFATKCSRAVPADQARELPTSFQLPGSSVAKGL